MHNTDKSVLAFFQFYLFLPSLLIFTFFKSSIHPTDEGDGQQAVQHQPQARRPGARGGRHCHIQVGWQVL